jgi:hypothetical protein
MPKLNQIIAVEKGITSSVNEATTKIFKTFDKQTTEGPFYGHTRTYVPKDDDGDRLPNEVKIVQTSVGKLLETVGEEYVRLIDVTATKDYANCDAKADIVINEAPVLSGVPVTHLLWLGKQLGFLHSELKKLPVLDPAETWTFDKNRSCYVSEPVETIRTKKIPRNHLLHEATKEHPAQVQVFTEDAPIGTWTATKFSGAIPADEKASILERCETLQAAVKTAVETANMEEAPSIKIGAPLLGYLLSS